MLIFLRSTYIESMKFLHEVTFSSHSEFRNIAMFGVIDYREFKDTEDGMVFGGKMSIPGFMKISHLFQTLLMQTDTLTYITHIFSCE